MEKTTLDDLQEKYTYLLGLMYATLVTYEAEVENLFG